MNFKEGLKVVSLFDGIACTLQALKQLNLNIKEYHAFEIDKYAMKIAKKHHPEIIYHGEIDFLTDFTEFKDIDLLVGGSPCQGFSYAGKKLNFNDPRSELFFEYARALKEIKPKHFLLENVKMKKAHSDVITSYLGVEPVKINSSLLSAQNRLRNYWCNWKVYQPKDKGIILEDIIDEDDFLEDTKTFRDGINLNSNDNSPMIKVCNVHPSGKGINGIVYHVLGKSPTITTNKGEGPKITGACVRGRKINPMTFKRDDKNPDLVLRQFIEKRKDRKSGTLTTFPKDNIILNGATYRKLNVRECSKLQGLPDYYCKGVSSSQGYKMLGNAFQVDTIEFILNQLLADYL
ncbi:DNA (cytosine-5-)-methyltransferase [Candidatus Dependentiae bacterium]|nr:MAG: DNA (cytosine-5-)-methyltransferase [Candidatus Dependentiae bacterium]